MKLTKYSIYILAQSADRWRVDAEYFDPMYNYLVHGFSPGSFFTALLANDAIGALSRSHPANTIPALKKLAGWILNDFPHTAFGSYPTVSGWIDLSNAERRLQLEQAHLVLTEQEEIIAALKDQPSKDQMSAVLFNYNIHA